MFKNYVKISLRNIKKQKVYSLLNIAGLTIGMSCCILIMLFIQDELSYDKFHKNGDRIFRVVASTSDDNIPTNANGIFGTGPALKREFPEVLEFARIREMGYGTKIFVKHGEKKFYEENFFFADSTFFTFFSFPLKRGNPETVLRKPNSIVITQETAERYFGNENPIDKILTVDPYNMGEMMEFTVTGIAENVPDNSHLQFDFLASYMNQKENLNTFQGMGQHYTYILLNDKNSAATLESKLLDFLKRNWREDPWYMNSLQPLFDIHLKSHLKSEIEPNGNIVYVYAFSAIAIFILLIACINFINLATSRSAKRAKEVGIRKVAGARRKQLIGQFLGESLILSFISGVVALSLSYALLPVFNNLAGKSVHFNVYNNPLISVGIGVIILVVGVVSGSYPSFILSTFRSVNVLKGKQRENFTGAIFRKGLGIALRQMNYVRTKDLGYNRNQIMVVPLNNVARNNYDALRNDLLMNPNIKNTTTSSHVPTKGTSHNSVKFEGIDEDLSIALYRIDKDFMDTYEIPFIAGENVINGIANKAGCDYIISESAVSSLGWEKPAEALGKTAQYRNYKGIIKGVVNDLNTDFHSELTVTQLHLSYIFNFNNINPLEWLYLK